MLTPSASVCASQAGSNDEYVVRLRSCYSWIVLTKYNPSTDQVTKAAIVPHLEAIATEVIWLDPCGADPIPPKGYVWKGIPSRAERGCSS